MFLPHSQGSCPTDKRLTSCYTPHIYNTILNKYNTIANYIIPNYTMTWHLLPLLPHNTVPTTMPHHLLPHSKLPVILFVPAPIQQMATQLLWVAERYFAFKTVFIMLEIGEDFHENGRWELYYIIWYWDLSGWSNFSLSSSFHQRLVLTKVQIVTRPANLFSSCATLNMNSWSERL